MSRDTGIRNLIPGYRDPEEIKEDQNTRRFIETIVNQRAPVRNVEPFGQTLARTTPRLNLEVNSRVTPKETKDFRSQKEYENHLKNSPTKRDHEKAFSMGRSLLKVSEAEKNKMAKQWMTGGGRDPKGRSLDQEIKLGKEEWLKKQKEEKIAKKPRPKPQYINGNVLDITPLIHDEWWLIKPEKPEDEDTSIPIEEKIRRFAQAQQNDTDQIGVASLLGIPKRFSR